MKNFARLTLFFSISFVVLFLAAVLLKYLSSWVELARIIPLGNEPWEDAAELAWKAFPVALYLSVLFTLSYTIRRNMHTVLAIIGILVLGCGISLGVSLAVHRTETLKFALLPVYPLEGKPGLILSRSESAVILLGGSRDVRGPRVVSIPGQNLIYQELPLGPNNTTLNVPALSFGDDSPWFIRSLDIDFSLSAGEMKSRLETDFISFVAYIFALILLLVSLRSLLELSRWPLANLFLGALIFRGILALEIFLNTPDINSLIASFLGNRLPSMLITPAVFCALAALFILYTLLTRLARPRRFEDG